MTDRTAKSRPTLLVAHTVSPERTATLRPALEDALGGDVIYNAERPSETRDLLPEVEMVLAGRFEAAWLDDAKNLRVVQALSAGVDFLPVDQIEEAGVALANSAGVSAEPIGEQVLGYMLQFERRLLEHARNQRRGVWERIEGGELRGKTVGIIGVGAIGSRVAELAQAFGMKVIGTKRSLDDPPAAVDELRAASEYHEVLQRADYVVLACPLTEATEEMIGMAEFRLLGSDAVLVNIARGGVVDQDALVRALQYGMIRGVALDVFEDEPLPPDSVLWDLSNVIITPHMAGSTPHKGHRWAEIVTTNYEAIVEDDLDSLVNRVV